MTDNTDKSIHLTQQWLTEIQVLRQQMAELRQERDQAWESSQKWCRLYNTEAEQRRLESQKSQQAIASVKAEVEKLQAVDIGTDVGSLTANSLQLEISPQTTWEQLKVKLITLAQERDRLLQALKTEQESHFQTRKSLTTALGDAIDSLAKARLGSGGAGEQGSGGAGED